MKLYITYFYNIRFFNPNQIGISTAAWQPKYWTFGQNENGAVFGLYEEKLSPKTIEPVDCQKDCPYKDLVPNCSFLAKYREYLDTVDFNYLMTEFNEAIEEVKKINNFTDEPEIILLVYEKPDNPCSERVPLIDYFKKHGVEIKEWTKEMNRLIF